MFYYQIKDTKQNALIGYFKELGEAERVLKECKEKGECWKDEFLAIEYNPQDWVIEEKVDIPVFADLMGW